MGLYHKEERNFQINLKFPSLSEFESIIAGSGDREISTTMAFVRVLNALLKDKQIGKNIVPIVPDEARTFGMEGMFRQFGIYSSAGQNIFHKIKTKLHFIKKI